MLSPLHAVAEALGPSMSCQVLSHHGRHGLSEVKAAIQAVCKKEEVPNAKGRLLVVPLCTSDDIPFPFAIATASQARCAIHIADDREAACTRKMLRVLQVGDSVVDMVTVPGLMRCILLVMRSGVQLWQLRQAADSQTGWAVTKRYDWQVPSSCPGAEISGVAVADDGKLVAAAAGRYVFILHAENPASHTPASESTNSRDVSCWSHVVIDVGKVHPGATTWSVAWQPMVHVAPAGLDVVTDPFCAIRMPASCGARAILLVVSRDDVGGTQRHLYRESDLWTGPLTFRHEWGQQGSENVSEENCVWSVPCVAHDRLHWSWASNTPTFDGTLLPPQQCAIDCSLLDARSGRGNTVASGAGGISSRPGGPKSSIDYGPMPTPRLMRGRTLGVVQSDGEGNQGEGKGKGSAADTTLFEPENDAYWPENGRIKCGHGTISDNEFRPAAARTLMQSILQDAAASYTPGQSQYSISSAIRRERNGSIRAVIVRLEAWAGFSDSPKRANPQHWQVAEISLAHADLCAAVHAHTDLFHASSVLSGCTMERAVSVHSIRVAGHVPPSSPFITLEQQFGLGQGLGRVQGKAACMANQGERYSAGIADQVCQAFRAVGCLDEASAHERTRVASAVASAAALDSADQQSYEIGNANSCTQSGDAGSTESCVTMPRISCRSGRRGLCALLHAGEAPVSTAIVMMLSYSLSQRGGDVIHQARVCFEVDWSSRSLIGARVLHAFPSATPAGQKNSCGVEDKRVDVGNSASSAVLLEGLAQYHPDYLHALLWSGPSGAHSPHRVSFVLGWLAARVGATIALGKRIQQTARAVHSSSLEKGEGAKRAEETCSDSREKGKLEAAIRTFVRMGALSERRDAGSSSPQGVSPSPTAAPYPGHEVELLPRLSVRVPHMPIAAVFCTGTAMHKNAVIVDSNEATGSPVSSHTQEAHPYGTIHGAAEGEDIIDAVLRYAATIHMTCQAQVDDEQSNGDIATVDDWGDQVGTEMDPSEPRLSTAGVSLLRAALLDPRFCFPGLESHCDTPVSAVRVRLAAFVCMFAEMHSDIGASLASLDSSGLRFLYASKWASAAELLQRRTLHPSPEAATALGSTALPWASANWAVLSDAQPAMLNLCLPSVSAGLTWSQLTSLRVPCWLHSDSILCELMERIGKTMYAFERDPYAAVLPYTCLGPGRLAVLRGLFKLSIQPAHGKVGAFLANDFCDPSPEGDRWRKAASKNAFALVSQHRYEAGAGFFLLAGRPGQAVKTLLQNVQDPVQALAVARLSVRNQFLNLSRTSSAVAGEGCFGSIDGQAVLKQASAELIAMVRAKGTWQDNIVAAVHQAAISTTSQDADTEGGSRAESITPASRPGFGFADDADRDMAGADWVNTRGAQQDSSAITNAPSPSSAVSTRTDIGMGNMRVSNQPDVDKDPVGFMLQFGFQPVGSSHILCSQDDKEKGVDPLLRALLLWLQGKSIEYMQHLAKVGGLNLGPQTKETVKPGDEASYDLLRHCLLAIPALKRPQIVRVFAHRVGLIGSEATSRPEAWIQEGIDTARDRAHVAAFLARSMELPASTCGFRPSAFSSLSWRQSIVGVDHWVGASLDRLMHHWTTRQGKVEGSNTQCADLSVAALKVGATIMLDSNLRALGLAESEPAVPLMEVLLKTMTQMDAPMTVPVLNMLLEETVENRSTLLTPLCQRSDAYLVRALQGMPSVEMFRPPNSSSSEHIHHALLFARLLTLIQAHNEGAEDEIETVPVLSVHCWLHAVLHALLGGPTAAFLLLNLLQLPSTSRREWAVGVAALVSAESACMHVCIPGTVDDGSVPGKVSSTFLVLTSEQVGRRGKEGSPSLEHWLDRLITAQTSALVTSIVHGTILRAIVQLTGNGLGLSPRVVRATRAWALNWHHMAMRPRFGLPLKKLTAEASPSFQLGAWQPNDGPRSALLSGICGIKACEPHDLLPIRGPAIPAESGTNPVSTALPPPTRILPVLRLLGEGEVEETRISEGNWEEQEEEEKGGEGQGAGHSRAVPQGSPGGVKIGTENARPGHESKRRKLHPVVRTDLDRHQRALPLTAPPWWADTGLLFGRTMPHTQSCAELWTWLGGPGWLWTLGMERRALARGAQHARNGWLPGLRTGMQVPLRMHSVTQPVLSLVSVRVAVGGRVEPLLLICAVGARVQHVEIGAAAVGAGALAAGSGSLLSPSDASAPPTPMAAPPHARAPAAPPAFGGRMHMSAAQVRASVEEGVRRMAASSAMTAILAPLPGTVQAPHPPPPIHANAVPVRDGGPNKGGPTPVILQLGGDSDIDAEEVEVDSGGGRMNRVAASSLYDETAAPQAPGTYLPIDRHMYTTPFTLVPEATAGHPILPLYARAGPGGAVASISVTEQQVQGGLQLTHAVSAVYGYEPILSETAKNASRPGGMEQAEQVGLAGLVSSGKTALARLGKLATAAGQPVSPASVRWDEHATCVRWSPDGETLSTAFTSGVVRIWDAQRTSRPKVTLQLQSSHVSGPSTADASALRPGEGRGGALGSMSPADVSWAASDLVVLTGNGHVLAVSGAPLFSAHALHRVLSAQAGAGAGCIPLPTGSSLTLFDTRTGSTPLWAGLPFPSVAGITCLLHDEPGLTLVAGGEDGSVQLFDLRTLTVRVLIQGVPIVAVPAVGRISWEGEGGLRHGVGSPHFGHAGAVTVLAHHPSSRLFCSGGLDGDVRTWSLPDAEFTGVLPRAHRGRPLHAQAHARAGSESGETLASGGLSVHGTEAGRGMGELLVGCLPHSSSLLHWDAGAWGGGRVSVHTPNMPCPAPYGVSGLVVSEEHVVSAGYDGAVFAHKQLW